LKEKENIDQAVYREKLVAIQGLIKGADDQIVVILSPLKYIYSDILDCYRRSLADVVGAVKEIGSKSSENY
jgi:hypothetical protein